MLQNYVYYAQLMLHKSTVKLHKFTISFLLAYKIIIDSSLSSLAHHQQFIYVYMFQHFEFFVAFVTLVSTYLTKLLPQIHPNLIISYKKYVFYSNFIDYADNFCLLCWHYAQCFHHPIMLKIMLAQ